MSASEETLGLLHTAVAEDLLNKIKSGEATPAEISAAIKFLKDNGIEAAPVENSRTTQLANSLPDFNTEGGLHERPN